MPDLVRARLVTFVVAALSLANADRALAQTPGTRPPVPHRQQVTTNPFGFIVAWYNGEYERKLTETWTLAPGGSYVSASDPDQRLVTAGVAFRYYPQRAALTGFWAGPRIGYIDFDDEDDADDERGPAVGFEIGYSWLLGAERHFSLSVGGGVSKMFSGPVVPTAKVVSLGWAF